MRSVFSPPMPERPPLGRLGSWVKTPASTNIQARAVAQPSSNLLRGVVSQLPEDEP